MKADICTKYGPPEVLEIKKVEKLTPKDGDLLKNSVIKIFTTFGSIISIGFGIWHFFVPGIWNWYSYIDKIATELVIAVRAINIFFSLLLVLLGTANIL